MTLVAPEGITRARELVTRLQQLVPGGLRARFLLVIIAIGPLPILVLGLTAGQRSAVRFEFLLRDKAMLGQRLGALGSQTLFL